MNAVKRYRRVLLVAIISLVALPLTGCLGPTNLTYEAFIDDFSKPGLWFNGTDSAGNSWGYASSGTDTFYEAQAISSFGSISSVPIKPLQTYTFKVDVANVGSGSGWFGVAYAVVDPQAQHDWMQSPFFVFRVNPAQSLWSVHKWEPSSGWQIIGSGSFLSGAGVIVEPQTFTLKVNRNLIGTTRVYINGAQLQLNGADFSWGSHRLGLYAQSDQQGVPFVARYDNVVMTGWSLRIGPAASGVLDGEVEALPAPGI